MKKLILDAGPLITSCRFTTAGQVVIDHLLAACDITIASSVRNEVVVAGQRYPDAQVAQQRINQASISVMSPPVNRDMEAVIGIYGLGEGEQDSMLLTRHSDLMDATLVLDDHLAYLVSDRLAVRKRFLLDAIADLVRDGDLDVQLALAIVEAIRSRYPRAFVEHTLLLLKR
jgi:hypothetical protein